MFVSLKLGEMIHRLTWALWLLNVVGKQEPPPFSASSPSYFWGGITRESDEHSIHHNPADANDPPLTENRWTTEASSYMY